jgi:uncharacterized protein (TIGR02118 family)
VPGVFAALGSNGSAVLDAARATGGTAYVAGERERDPVFAALALGADRAALERVGDLGLYAVDVRRMRHQRRTWPVASASPGVTAAFVMVRRPDLSHEEADAHWRDVHAPLALRHHPGMWHYHQVSITDVLAGPAYDGIALCAFASQQEMSERFFGGPEDQAIISADVATFADTTNSPRRVRTVEWRCADDDG